MQELNAMRKKVFLLTAIAIGLIVIGFLLFMGMPFIGMPLFIIGIVASLITAGTIGGKFTLLYKVQCTLYTIFTYMGMKKRNLSILL